MIVIFSNIPLPGEFALYDCSSLARYEDNGTVTSFPVLLAVNDIRLLAKSISLSLHFKDTTSLSLIPVKRETSIMLRSFAFRLPPFKMTVISSEESALSFVCETLNFLTFLQGIELRIPSLHAVLRMCFHFETSSLILPGFTTPSPMSPIETHRRYGERATCETWVEECKNQMNAGHLRTSEFLANAALFHCAVLAYNLLKWMALLVGGVIKQWEVKTMRLWLIRVAGKLTRSGRQWVLKLPEKFLHQEEWREWERMSLIVDFR